MHLVASSISSNEIGSNKCTNLTSQLSVQLSGTEGVSRRPLQKGFIDFNLGRLISLPNVLSKIDLSLAFSFGVT